MSVPQALQQAAEQAWNQIQRMSEHEYAPVQRVALLNIFETLNTETALAARQWLAILSGYRVMGLYEPSLLIPPAEIVNMPLDEFAAILEAMRFVRADEAIGLAVRVMQNKFNREQASQIAGAMHYSTGFAAASLRSLFIEMVANKALGAACSKLRPFHAPGPTMVRIEDGKQVLVPWEQQRDVDWVTSGQGDSAGVAAVAWALDDSEITGKEIADAWNWWTDHPLLNPSKVLEFWHWWLLEAIPQAWNMAVQSENHA